MIYDFSADKGDKLDILTFIFEETDLCVYDSYSEPDHEICKYKSVDEISSKFDLTNGGDSAVTFQLWSPRHKGSHKFRKFSLNPDVCNGHTFRYATEGFGLIQLYFGGLRDNELHKSHIGHFNEKGALKINPQDAKCCDWKEIQITSRKLKSYIRNRLSIKKMKGMDILKGANILEQQGVELRRY